MAKSARTLTHFKLIFTMKVRNNYGKMQSCSETDWFVDMEKRVNDGDISLLEKAKI